MGKPETASGYEKEVTENCERLLVTLLRNLGPWKESIYLVGGLTPRYLIPKGKTQHAGTGDVDVVVKLEMLADTEAYRSLEENLKQMGFERAKNDKGQPQSWRWQKRAGRSLIILELLADNPEVSGGKVKPLPTEGNISALNIPHASMVFDHYETKTITAELLDNKGIATEKVRHADIASFTCLKAFALDDRYEPKDAHDLVYCIENAEEGTAAIAEKFRAARDGKHAGAVKKTLEILARRFTTQGGVEGYLRDGAVAVAAFEIEGNAEEVREVRILRQRQASEIITALLMAIG
jgi:hypothetical protein